MGWPPSPVHMLNQKFRFVGIHFDSVRLEIAIVVDPTDPLANDDGIVARPNVDIEGELVSVMRARRAYGLSLKVIETEDEMMGSLLDNPI